MFKFATLNHPPVRAVIWDLDGMVVQFRGQQGAVTLTDLELLVQFILELSQKYTEKTIPDRSEKYILDHASSLFSLPD